MRADASQAPEHLGDIAAEHAAQHMQFVDDDVPKTLEVGAPIGVHRQHAHVQHFRIGEQNVCVRTRPLALFG